MLARGHLPHAIKPFDTPVSAPLWTDEGLDGRLLYLKTLQDATFPPEAQQMFIDGSDVCWDVVDGDGGHEVFLTQPKVAADAIIDVLEKWRIA